MSNSLLPPTASQFLRRTETATARINAIPVELHKLWDPDKCPVIFLPYLAWALSVDRWDKNWSEQTKRAVIRAAFMVHRQKGTIHALRRVVEPFGFLIRVSEWWQTGEEPGTFRLDIGVQEQGITEETYQELERLIQDAKPLSRHLIGLSIQLQSAGELYVGAATFDGAAVTVYPYLPEEIAVGGDYYPASAIHLIENTRVNA
ncbi:phage tail protein, P2 protein I family [Kosakonia radicincitans]|uniref:phage tail protein I n=1 Tax=Kosakonia radicincitans TaxID=283686 RepID=UPI0009A82DFE|nr:phage tail protein I [Kosakonia radicincitans]SKC23415.1 phage tail protein, P2 protein I family [Kosakonia radicincitans]